MVADPMDGYIPIEHFIETDDDASTSRIRDMPYGKRREQLLIYPTELIFPQTKINTVSPPYPVMVTNTGYDIVFIKNIQMVSNFAFFGQSTIASLIPGQHVSFRITFNPKRIGAITGGIYFNSVNAVGDQFIYLSGNGIQ